MKSLEKQKWLLKGASTATLILAAALSAAPPAASATEGSGEQVQDPRVRRGELSYRVHCASCHGAEARGDGPMVEVLKVQPPNLTLLSSRNEGTFPTSEVHQTIDGRDSLAAHGSRTMPVWGSTFQTRGLDQEDESEVMERIRDLVAYLESIQAAEE